MIATENLDQLTWTGLVRLKDALVNERAFYNEQRNGAVALAEDTGHKLDILQVAVYDAHIDSLNMQVVLVEARLNFVLGKEN